MCFYICFAILTCFLKALLVLSFTKEYYKEATVYEGQSRIGETNLLRRMKYNYGWLFVLRFYNPVNR